jgi:molybdopterin synthase catalytic subunit
MKVRVLVFGVLKDWLGTPQTIVDLPEGATVAALLASMNARQPALLPRGIAVSVNAEFTSAAHVLHDGDEVGLLPPVSGGAGETGQNSEGSTCLTHEPIDAAKILAAAKAAEDGAVVVFDGIVRNQTRGRATLYLDYEGYEKMALRQMEQLARQARSQFGVRHVTLVHRLGRLQIGESSVLIVVASAHRAQAFEACRWLIDSLKKTVPIWKKETFADGAVWTDGEPFPDGVAVEIAKPLER